MIQPLGPQPCSNLGTCAYPSCLPCQLCLEPHKLLAKIEQVCQRVLSLEEANAICDHAQKISGGQAVGVRSTSFAPLLGGSPTPPSGAAAGPDASGAVKPRQSSPNAAADGVGASASAGGDAEGEGTAMGEGQHGEPDPRRSSAGLKQYSASDGGDLNDLLSSLFKKADTEKKVRRQQE